MNKTIEESKREWQKALWLIIACIFGTLAASVIGLILLHGLPGWH